MIAVTTIPRLAAEIQSRGRSRGRDETDHVAAAAAVIGKKR